VTQVTGVFRENGVAFYQVNIRIRYLNLEELQIAMN
jgi:hypothetical protein